MNGDSQKKKKKENSNSKKKSLQKFFPNDARILQYLFWVFLSVAIIYNLGCFFKRHSVLPTFLHAIAKWHVSNYLFKILEFSI